MVRKRNRFLSIPFPVLFGLLILIGSPVPSSAAEQSRPNIIFIMVDDMGYADAGCYGGTQIQTPNVDRMATEGMRFTDCYAGSPVCAPSRSVLMTGQHTGRTTVRGNTGKGGVKGLGGRPGRVPLNDDDVTIAEVLQSKGYVTGMTGKWGLGEPNTSGEPTRQGFDHWFGFLNQKRAHDHFPDSLWLGTEKFDLPGNERGNQQYSHDLFTGFALNFIRRHKSKPFFLYLPYTVPHDRFDVPDFGPYADRPWTAQQKGYAAMITRADSDVGRIFKLLKELSLDQSTLVFFCSDNGAANRYEGVFDSSGQLRGRKRDMTEGGIRTPMVARWPGHVPAGTVSDVPWMFHDVLPTVASLCGAEVPDSVTGIDIGPVLLDEVDTLPDRYLYWEFYEGGFKQAVRFGDWKAIRSRPKSALELYRLSEDIGEANNIAAEHPQVVQQFEAYLKTARVPSKAWPSPVD